MHKKAKQIMACALVFLLMVTMLPELSGGKVHAASSSIITTVAGNGDFGYSGDGGAANGLGVRLNGPSGVAVDSVGNLYIADQINNRIRKVDKSGIISTVAGNGTSGYSGDNGPAKSAQLSYPQAVTVDGSDNLYIVDQGNQRIRKVDKSGNISTVAGNGSRGYSGDEGPATSAQLDSPYGIAFDSSGNMYIADTNNNRIRKVDTSGKIVTVAGPGTFGNLGDGGDATLALLSHPSGVAVDSTGNLYIADRNNFRIRKVDTSGKISTVAGDGTTGNSGDGGDATLAKLKLPEGIAFDNNNNLYIVDRNSHQIRKVDLISGKISTVAGNGTGGYKGDGEDATSAQLNAPYAVAVDSSGVLYIADTSNNRIRKVAAAYTISFGLNGGTGPVPASMTVSPGQASPALPSGTGLTGPAGKQNFDGWNTKADGSGTSYAANASISNVASDIILFAKWSNAFTVTFDLNGGTGTVPSSIKIGEGPISPPLPNNSGFTGPTGKTFGGWSTKEDGTGQRYSPGVRIPYLTSNITLYAMWFEAYTITFDLNGGTGTAPVPMTVLKGEQSWPLPNDTGIIAPPGKDFDGWNTKANGKGNRYVPGLTIPVLSDFTLYVDWYSEDLNTYNVHFDSQGGTSVGDLDNVNEGSTISAPTVPTRTDYTFGGWYKEATLENVWNFATDIVTKDVTLYAKWTREVKVPAPSFEPVPVPHPGTGPRTTGIPNITPGTGNHLVVKVSSSMIETPNTGDTAPTGTGIIDPYTAGSDIPGVDARVNRYVGIYEVDEAGKVVKFSLIILESEDIQPGEGLPDFDPKPAPRPGTQPGTTDIPNVTPGTGNHLVVKVSSTMIETPNTGDTAPTGTGIIDPYTAGSDIPGVDARVNRYVGIYEVDEAGKVVKFSLVVLTDKDVKSEAGDLDNDKNNLGIVYQEGDHAEHVTKTLYLPAKGQSGHTTVTWTLSHPEVIKPNGRVNRAGAYDSDVYVTLTATITDEVTGSQTTKTFIVKVIRMSDEDIVREAAKDLTAEKAFTFTEGDTWESVTSEFTLLGQGLYGTNITWSSIDPGTIGISLENGKAYGSVNRPQSSDKNVLLSAVIKKGNASITKTFLMVVKNKSVGKEADQTRQPTGRQAEASVNPSGTFSRDEFMILRTTLNNGSRIDTVIIDPSKVEGLTDAINPSEKDESKRTIAIQLQHAPVDKADEFAIEIPSQAVAAIADRNALLEIKTDEGSIKLSAAALQDSADKGTDLYFRLVPIKDAREQNEAKNVLTSNSLVNQSADGKSIQILSIPRKIETNFSGFATKVVIPFYGVTIPEQNKQAFLDSLKVFVEHTDGTTELLSGVVQYENEQPVGLEIQINRFSRFQFVNFASNDTSNGSPNGGSGGGGTVKSNDFVPSPSLNPGSTTGTTSVIADNIGKGNHLVIKVSSSTISAPKIGDAAPTGAGVLDPYAPRSDIKGADAEVNKYIAVYEVDSNNRIVKFMLLIVKKGDIKVVNGLIDLFINDVIQKDTAKLEVRGAADKDAATIIVDNEAIIQKLQTEKAESTLTVPPVIAANHVEVEMSGQLLKLMYEKSNVLRFETENATYILPVTAINLKGLLESLSNPSDLGNVKFRLAISNADPATAAQMKEQVKKGQAEMLITPVKFEVTGSYNGKVVSVDVFNRYVARLIKLSSGINPEIVTTGVYIRDNGQMAHIPTMVETINGVPYAKIQSLYNGLYTLVNHPLKFKDVESHWSKAEVNDLASRLVVFGTDKEHFTSNRDITRAEFAAIIVRALGLKHGNSKANPFSDVKDTAWYAESIQIAFEFGIIDGYNNGKFAPLEPITREQAMTMIARAMKITGLNVGFETGEADTLLAAFKDSAQSSTWAKESIAACVKAGIVTGKSDTTVAPKDAITRAEVAKIVAKLLQKSNLI